MMYNEVLDEISNAWPFDGFRGILSRNHRIIIVIATSHGDVSTISSFCAVSQGLAQCTYIRHSSLVPASYRCTSIAENVRAHFCSRQCGIRADSSMTARAAFGEVH